MQITSFQTALPLKLQLHQAVGIGACFIAMIGIYYGNGWDSKSLPFMSTQLHMANGTSYPLDVVFPGGVLDKSALADYGVPRLTGTFAFSMFMANAAVSAKLLRRLRKLKHLLDWCLDSSLHSLLGQRYSASV